jgi:two-component sensor histidine kinase
MDRRHSHAEDSVEIFAHGETSLREAHHRIANDLAVIAGMARLQAQSVGGAARVFTGREVAAILNDTAGRIEAVARLHRLLCYSMDGRIAAEFLNAVCADAASFAGVNGAKVTCSVSMAAEPGPERLRSLGLLVHELVVNALKHAHPAGLAPCIEVQCNQDAHGALALDVRDDGVGFPEDFDPHVDGGFGFRMMRQLAKQLDALLAFESTPLGLICSVRGRRASAA